MWAGDKVKTGPAEVDPAGNVLLPADAQAGERDVGCGDAELQGETVSADSGANRLDGELMGRGGEGFEGFNAVTGDGVVVSVKHSVCWYLESFKRQDS